MKLKMFKELDLFGQDIKWRLLSKDSFKSLFGAFITIILTAIFVVKIYFFVKKVDEYGFAKNKETLQFRKEFQFLNMSEFKLAIYSDLENIIYDYELEKNVTIYNRTYFNLSDFIDVFPRSYVYEKNINKTVLEPRLTDCSENKKFEFLSNESDVEEMAFYKCIDFQENFNFINVTKNETYLIRQNGEYTNIQLDTIKQFDLLFEMKQPLIDFVKKSRISYTVYILYVNYRLDPDNYELKEFTSQLRLTIDPDSEIQGSISFRKQSVTKKLEFDIFEAEISDSHEYEIEDLTFKTIKKPREKDKYYDSLKFYLDIFELNNEITLFTFDDIMATLGGFMQVFLTLAEFIVAGYNQNLVQRVLSNFCMEKYANYDKTLNHVRNNIHMQMDYYSKSKLGKRFDKDYEKNEISNNINNNKIDLEDNQTQRPSGNLIAGKNFDDNNSAENAKVLISDDKEAKDKKFSYKDQEDLKKIDTTNYQIINQDIEKCLTDKVNFEEPNLISEQDAAYLPETSKSGGNKLNIMKKTKPQIQQEYNTEHSPTNQCLFDNDIKAKQYNYKSDENIVTVELIQKNADFENKNSYSFNNNSYNLRIIPKTKRRKKYFEPEFDFMEFISIERYMSMLSGFEAFKFYYFNDMNKFNFECLADLFIFSENYNLKNKDRKFFLNEQSIPNDHKQKEIFERFLKYIKHL